MSDTQSNIDVVKQFVEAWSRLDVEELVSFLRKMAFSTICQLDLCKVTKR